MQLKAATEPAKALLRSKAKLLALRTDTRLQQAAALRSTLDRRPPAESPLQTCDGAPRFMTAPRLVRDGDGRACALNSTLRVHAKE